MEGGSEINRAGYDAIADEWDEARRVLGAQESRYLEVLLEGVPRGSLVLDAGCGTGRPLAAEAIARGHRLTGIDQSAAMLAKARARFPGETWIEARLEDSAFGDRCDAVILWDTLFHIERQYHERILRCIASSLRAGGRVMLTVGGSDHPPFTDTMFGETFFYDSHPPERAVEIVERAGLVPKISEFIDLPAGGREKGRYAIVAEKA